MKFSTAAAVLIARTIPTADSSSSSFEDVVVAATIKTKKDDVRGHPFSPARPLKTVGGGSPLAGERRKLKQWAQTQSVVSPLLLQSKLAAAVEEGEYLGEECDPSSADVLGVLSCGPGRYCVESSRFVAGEMGEEGIPAATTTSSLGGFCVKDASQGINNHRQLQDYYDPISKIGQVNYLCYNNTDPGVRGLGFNYECNGIDVEAYTGSATFTMKEPFCWSTMGFCGLDFASTTGCSYSTWEYTFTGPYNYTFTHCVDPVELDVLSSCVTYTYTGRVMGPKLPATCSFQVNGTTCNSCVATEYDNAYGIPGYTAPCYIYDCSNTAMESQGYICGGTLFLALGGFRVVDKNEEIPCDGGCFLCGEGESVADGLYVNTTVPGFEYITCSYLQQGALTARYGPLICSNDTYRAGLAAQCGCSVGDTENTPSDPPVMPPTEEDNGSAPTNPPAEEDDGSSGASTTAIMTTGLHGLAIAAVAVAAAVSLN